MTDYSRLREYGMTKLKSSKMACSRNIQDLRNFVTYYAGEREKIKSIFDLYEYMETHNHPDTTEVMLSYKDVSYLIELLDDVGGCQDIIDLWTQYAGDSKIERHVNFAYDDWNKCPEVFYDIYSENVDIFTRFGNKKHIKMLCSTIDSIDFDTDIHKYSTALAWEMIFQQVKNGLVNCGDVLQVLDEICSVVANIWKKPENIARRESYVETKETEFDYKEWDKCPDLFYELAQISSKKYGFSYIKKICSELKEIETDNLERSSVGLAWLVIIGAVKEKGLCSKFLKILDRICPEIAENWKKPENIDRRKVYLEKLTISDSFYNDWNKCPALFCELFIENKEMINKLDH